MTHFVVIGGGSWGAAIASSLQRAQQPVTVLARDQQTVDMLVQGRCPKLADCAADRATYRHHRSPLPCHRHNDFCGRASPGKCREF